MKGGKNGADGTVEEYIILFIFYLYLYFIFLILYYYIIYILFLYSIFYFISISYEYYSIIIIIFFLKGTRYILTSPIYTNIERTNQRTCECHCLHRFLSLLFPFLISYFYSNLVIQNTYIVSTFPVETVYHIRKQSNTCGGNLISLQMFH